MKHQFLVSTIIVNWNGLRFLESCLSSLAQQTFTDYEVILADNGSTDDSVAFVGDHYPWVRTIKLGRNYGYAEGNNLAAQSARGSYLFFLNNDTKLDLRCLERLVAAAKETRDRSIFACRQLSYDGSFHLSQGVKSDVLGCPVSGASSTEQKFFYADGASLFIRRDSFLELDMFDPRYFLFAEDTDLCWRARLRGYQIQAVPEAVVYHYSGGSLPGGAAKNARYETNHFRRYLGERNMLRNLLKNYSASSLLWVLPTYGIVNIAEMLLFAVIGRVDVAYRCYLKAWWWNITQLHDTLRQRRIIQASRTVNDREILRHMELTIGKFHALRRMGIPQFSRATSNEFSSSNPPGTEVME